MTPRSRTLTAGTLAGLGLASLVSSYLFDGGAGRGWAKLAGFALLGAPFLLGMWPQWPSRQNVAFGAYMLVAAVTFSVRDLWPARPAWLDTALTGAFVLGAGWCTFESIRAMRARARSG